MQEPWFFKWGRGVSIWHLFSFEYANSQQANLENDNVDDRETGAPRGGSDRGGLSVRQQR